MSVDLFGRHLSKEQYSVRGPSGPPGVGFQQTESGDFDIENKRLCKVGKPIENGDAINLGMLLTSIIALERKVTPIEVFKTLEKEVIRWADYTELGNRITSMQKIVKKQEEQIVSMNDSMKKLEHKVEGFNIRLMYLINKLERMKQ